MSTTSLLYTTAARARRKRAFAAISAKVVTDFLAMAERKIEARCGRVFSYDDARTAYYDGMNKPYFYLSGFFPIVSLSALAVIDANGNEDSIDVSGSDADVTLDTDNGKVAFGPNNTSIYSVFPKTYPRNIKATFASGYDLPTAASNTPDDDLQEAVILQAMIIYAESSLNMNAGLRRQKIGAGEKARLSGQDYDQMNEQLDKLLTKFIEWEM